MGGHLFVLHGRIESVLHDAAVVVSDDAFTFRTHWAPLLDASWARPDDWAERRWARIGGRVWAISVGGSVVDSFEAILERLTSAVVEAAYVLAESEPRGGRQFPLIALPFVGVGAGGYGELRGTIVRQLIAWAEPLAADLGVDLALTTPDTSLYAAAQHVRSTRLAKPDPDARRLGDVAREQGLALLTGAGTGIPAGLPSWSELVDELVDTVTGIDRNSIDHLTAVDQAELIEHLDPDGFQERVATIVGRAAVPSVLHVLLAGLDVREIVTTNYDTLYELAVTQTGRGIETVLPWRSVAGSDRWILKLHGDVVHKDKIVLTRRHMVRYDAANRPSGALLQALLLTRHLLMVGVSLTDDNLIRLAHEVQAYREEHQSKSAAFGTLLDVSGDTVRAQLWNGQIDWLAMPGEEVGTRARSMELFLDEVAIHASNDNSWLLDERFSGLMSDPKDQEIAEQARRLASRLSGRRWESLRRVLREYGAD